MREEREWPRLAKGIGRPELVDDPRFASRAARREHSAALIRILDEVFAEKDWEEWRQVFEASQITSGPVARLGDVCDDPQMRATEVIVPIEDGERPELLTVAGPICIADQPPRRPGSAPSVGQHTDEVLRAAGYNADAIAKLRARKIVG
jgi:formyl-CoA transferase